MTKTLSEILGFGQPATPMTPADRAAEKEKKKKEREAKKEQQAATREKRQDELKKRREANKAAKSIRHDDREENRDKARLDIAAQNARGAARRANAMKNRQTTAGGVSTRSAVRRNNALIRRSTARTATAYQTAANSAKYHQDRVKANLQKASTEYDMSTIEIISESCMVGLNEDMYFKVKIEGLPTMYVNSANREELRKDLVGLLRNPSKAVGDIKRVTPQEVKKRLRLRSQGKEEEEMNETYIKFDHPKLTYISKGFNDRRGATLHNDQLVGSGKASHKSFVQKHKDNKFYVVDVPAPLSRFKESSVTRSRISGEMDKASGRTQIDRKNDLAKAAAARQDSEKDLAAFRKKNAKVLQSSIDEVTSSDVSAAYQRAMMHPAESSERKQAMDYYKSVAARHKKNPIDVGEATADVINKLKNHYMNESSAYYTGLSKSTADDRKAHFKKHGKKADDDNSAYKPAPGDATAKTKPSIHTKKAAAMGMGPTDEACWSKYKQVGMKKKGEKMVPNCVPKNESYNINENKKGLENKAEKSGMPLGVLKQVYNRGLAAWKTGHRPGTTPEQWGMARVNSFITKSSGTWGKADKDLAAKVKK